MNSTAQNSHSLVRLSVRALRFYLLHLSFYSMEGEIDVTDSFSLHLLYLGCWARFQGLWHPLCEAVLQGDEMG